MSVDLGKYYGIMHQLLAPFIDSADYVAGTFADFLIHPPDIFTDYADT